MARPAFEGSTQYHWFQPSLGARAYVLRDPAGDTAARLEFEPAPTVGWEFTNPKAARAFAGDRQWRFTVSRHGVSGMLGWSAVVHVHGSETAAIHLGGFASRGDLVIEGGRTFRWDGKTVRGSTSVFSIDEHERVTLVLFSTGAAFDRIPAAVEVTPRGLGLPEWPLLATLGFYLRILISRTWR